MSFFQAVHSGNVPVLVREVGVAVRHPEEALWSRGEGVPYQEGSEALSVEMGGEAEAGMSLLTFFSS